MTGVHPDLSDALTAAKALLGWRLIHRSKEGTSSGFIVETEAYTSEDEASHAFRGPTRRSAVMFKPAGFIYIYLSYGIHFGVNIVTGEKDQGQGVLIRALQPELGISLMRQRRNSLDDRQLTNGPGKLTQALGIGPSLNGQRLGGDLWLEPGIKPTGIVQTTRIGITKAVEYPWRFYIEDNPYVSRR